MSRPRPQFRRPDLLYRQLIRDEQDAPHDALFDSLTRKVVEFLHNKDIGEWEANEWGTYKAMLAQHQKQPLMQGKSSTEEIGEMTEDQLRTLTSSEDHVAS
jgi:hypothetical protein